MARGLSHWSHRFPRCETFRLYGRGEAGVCCDVDGVGLGPLKLVERAEKSYFVRPVEDIIQMLEAAYGPLPGAVAEDLVLKIVGIARSLNGGNMTQAMLKTLYLRLPEIPAENMAKMGRGVMLPERAAAEEALNKALLLSFAENRAVEKAEMATSELEKAGFNINQARDLLGRWVAELMGHFSGSHNTQAYGKGHIITGNATYYNPPRGARTASGESFDPNGQKAAMYQPDIHMGDVVRVQLQSDPSRYIDVTVNDHGPFAIGSDGHAERPLRAHPENVIDLTRRSFRDLTGNPKIGKVPVVVTKISEKKKRKP
jgi:rare lipoprotein A (peptidoglycan hydrolase)